MKYTMLNKRVQSTIDLDGVWESVLGVALRHRHQASSQVRWHWVDTEAEQGVGETYAERRAKETVVLIHGYPESWYGWRNQFAALADGYRLIALDLKGFGRSRGTERRASAYHPLRVAEEILTLLDDLGIHRFNLVAHSLGSIVSDYLAGTQPSRVLRYARIQAASEVSERPGLWQREVLSGYRQAVLRHRAPQLVRSTYERCCRREIPEADIARMEADFHLPGVAEAVSSYSDARWPQPSWRAEQRDRVELFARMEMPVLMIQGDSVPEQPASDYEQTAAFLPQGSLELIPDCGAFAHAERPGRVNAALLALFERPTAAPLCASENTMHSSVR